MANKRGRSGQDNIVYLPEQILALEMLRFRSDLADLVFKRQQIDKACGIIYGTGAAADLFFMSLFHLLCAATPEAYQEVFGASPESDRGMYSKLYNDALRAEREGGANNGK